MKPLRSHFLVLLCLFLVQLATLSCGAPARTCGPSTCQGCCDATGMCQVQNTPLTCGLGGQMCLACSAGTVCSAFGQCSLHIEFIPDDGGVDAGQIDAGTKDGGTDAGSSCMDGPLLGNPSFECGQTGWDVVAGSANTQAGGWNSATALELKGDSTGHGRIARNGYIEVVDDSVLCVGIAAKGTVETVHLDVMVSPGNNTTSFASPVSADWQAIPPAMLKVPLAAHSKALIVVRAEELSAPGKALALDGLNAYLSSTNSCSW